MNKFYYLFAMLLFVICGGLQAKAAVVNEADHFSCTFETEADYNQWTKVDINGVDGNGQSDVWYDSDWKAANFNAGLSQANDEWLISPAFTVTGGKTYTVKVKFYCDYAGKMAFYLGQGTTAEAMTVEVSPTTEYGEETTHEVSFTVPAGLAAGEWHLGVHCTSDAYTGPVYLQNIELQGAAAAVEADHFFCNFQTEADYNKWTKINVNGTDANGQSDVWYDSDWKAASFNAGVSKADDEWLISPAFTVTGGKAYKVRVKFYCDYAGKMAFYLGQGTTAEAMTVEVSPTKEYGEGTTHEFTLDVPAALAAGEWHLGVHCTSDAYSGPVYLQEVEVLKGEEAKGDDYYYCGFNTQEEYNKWTHIDVNGLDDNDSNTVWWDEDWKAAQFNPGVSKANDEWLISPAVKLEGGEGYALKVKFYCDWPGKMAFYMGQGTTAEAMTTELSPETEYGQGTHAELRLNIPGNLAAGDWNFGVHCTTKGWSGPVYLQSVEVVKGADVDYVGTVLDSEKQTPVEGATVKFESSTYKSQERTTDAEGKFTFNGLTPGAYDMTITKTGYDDFAQKVTVSEAQPTGSFNFVQKSVSVVQGKVVDEAGTAMKGVTVKLSGKLNYETTTGDDGSFRFDEVMRKEAYTMTIERNWKEKYSETLDAQDTEINLGDMVLKTYVSEPLNLKADIVDAGAIVSWLMPMRKQEFAYDNGEYGGTYQFNGGSYNVVGNVFNEPAVVTGAKWLLSSDSSAGETVDLRVYALNKDGSISDKILYEEKDVPNKNYTSGGEVVWNEYTFKTPVVAPYGYVLAVGCNGTISVCADYTSAGHSVYMLQGGFRSSSVSVFFIRALGSSLASTPKTAKAAAAPALDVRCVEGQTVKRAAGNEDEMAPTYNLYRLNASDKENREAWTTVETGFNTMSYIDRDFGTLGAGTYLYAVEAVYNDGKVSEPAFTENVDNKVFTTVKANVYTNTALDFSENAVVTLVNEENKDITYTAVVKSGIATFDKVRKGVYTAKIVKSGFSDLTVEHNNYSSESLYESGFELQLIARKPFNLQTENSSNGIVLTWNKDNGYFEDCEGMTDFQLNPAGEIGWTYADVDGCQTYGVQQCQANPYPNMFSEMAFQAFNPGKTVPSILDLVQPHSGDKMLIDASLATGGRNNDYMFSPELSFDDDITFSFYAASGFYAAMGKEEFMVGYTTGDAKPDNVVWLTEQPVEVGALWTEFTYTLPKEAKHAVIRCVSNQHMFFMLDDIFVGQKEPETSALTTYNVSLDEEDLGNTAGRSFVLGNLDDGKHIAKVQTVYSMFDDSKSYSDFAELIFRIKGGLGVESVSSEVLYTYENGVVTLGANADAAALYDVQGRKVASCNACGTISTADCQAGVYVLKVLSEGRTSVSKILVK